MHSSHSSNKPIRPFKATSVIYGALAVANPELTPMQTTLMAMVVPKDDDRAAKDPAVEYFRRQEQQWAVAREVKMMLGMERLIRTSERSIVSFGHLGVISGSLFERLHLPESPLVTKQLNLPLRSGEVSQVLLAIHLDKPTEQCEFYVIHIHHTAESGSTLRDDYLVIHGTEAVSES